MDRSLDAAERPGARVWLRPSQALERFEAPEAPRLRMAEEGRSRLRYGYRVGSLSFLIPSGAGSEVVPLTSPAAIPNSPDWLLGVVNLRGSLAPVFDLAIVLGVGEDRAAGRDDGSGTKPMILILDKGERAAGVLIDDLPRPLTGLRPVAQVPQLPEALRAFVPAAYADDAGIWLELGYEGLLLELGARAERAAA